MGAAPGNVQEAELTQEQAHDAEREWFLDGESGELKPEGSDHQEQGRPGPVRVARWTFD